MLASPSSCLLLLLQLKQSEERGMGWEMRTKSKLVWKRMPKRKTTMTETAVAEAMEREKERKQETRKRKTTRKEIGKGAVPLARSRKRMKPSEH